jgi:Mg2+ and Co2+ transporter CorA
VDNLRQLNFCIQQNERFSKHGKYFSPFFQYLTEQKPTVDTIDRTPMLLSVPFLDWTVQGEAPPLRFQIDPREGYQSSRTSSHLLRSILQHFYRLEDTSDREYNQVFSKHKPWTTDRELDLKVRRWFGQYPTALNVDELWILLIDAQHVVTFSSNQSWKSRWPPLQLSSRILEVSFRGIRNSFLLAQERSEYNAATHAVATLNAALGMLHRSFWVDIQLCLTDRYAGYLGNLQYRLHRAPSTRLVMDLLQVQEELNIIIQITEQQLTLIQELQLAMKFQDDNEGMKRREKSNRSSHQARPIATHTLSHPFRATYRQYSSSNLADPMSQLIENLSRELTDLEELRDNTNNLLNRTIQLVNIRLEDHGKAILVFTIVTIIFLPMSFAASFFGMNVTDIRNMEQNQGIFWLVSGCLTIGVVSLAVLLAFYGGDIVESFFKWKEKRRRKRQIAMNERYRPRERLPRPTETFQVLDASIPRTPKW